MWPLVIGHLRNSWSRPVRFGYSKHNASRSAVTFVTVRAAKKGGPKARLTWRANDQAMKIGERHGGDLHVATVPPGPRWAHGQADRPQHRDRKPIPRWFTCLTLSIGGRQTYRREW